MSGIRSFAWILALLMVGGGAAFGERPGEGKSSVGSYNLPGEGPHLLAHYLAWFSTDRPPVGGEGVDRTSNMWSHWQWKGGKADHDPARVLPNGHRDVASVMYPLIGPYDSSSPEVVRYHLATMKAAGIEGIIIDWYAHSDTDKRVPLILDEAQKLDMRVALMWEEKLCFPNYRHPKSRADVIKAATEDLTYILKKYGHHPAYLRRNNEPVIAQFDAYGPADPVFGPRKLSPEEFATIFKALPENPSYIRQGLEAAYHPLLEGAYTWENRKGYPTQFVTAAEKLRDQHKLDYFVTMLNPGFNDTGVWGWGSGPRISTLYGLPKLKETTDHALTGKPELIQLITWNDFNEGTCFEPTTEYGFQFIDAVETWWSGHSNHKLELADNRGPFDRYKQSCSADERRLIPGDADGATGEKSP